MNKPAEQIPLDLQSRPALGRQDFLIGAANKDAVAWIDRWPNWPAPVLVLNGPAASGKSHLAAVWQERSKAEAIRPEMLLSKTADQIASAGKALIFDGLDPWLGEREAESKLFHIYNIFKEEGRQFLITTRMAPNQTDFAVKDLASRLRAAPLAQIHPPEDDLLSAILIKLFHDRQLQVSAETIRYILPRMERSFAAARDIVTRADQKALAEKRAVSIPLLRQVMAEIQA